MAAMLGLYAEPRTGPLHQPDAAPFAWTPCGPANQRPVNRLWRYSPRYPTCRSNTSTCQDRSCSGGSVDAARSRSARQLPNPSTTSVAPRFAGSTENRAPLKRAWLSPKLSLCPRWSVFEPPKNGPCMPGWPRTFKFRHQASSGWAVVRESSTGERSSGPMKQRPRVHVQAAK